MPVGGIMFDWSQNPLIWASLLTLTAFEIVPGIDNVSFIPIETNGRNP